MMKAFPYLVASLLFLALLSGCDSQKTDSTPVGGASTSTKPKSAKLSPMEASKQADERQK